MSALCFLDLRLHPFSYCEWLWKHRFWILRFDDIINLSNAVGSCNDHQKTQKAELVRLCDNVQTSHVSAPSAENRLHKIFSPCSKEVPRIFLDRLPTNVGETFLLFYQNGVKVECLLMHFLSMSLMWLQARPMHVRRPRLCSCDRRFLSDWPTSWRKLISSLTSSSALHP